MEHSGTQGQVTRICYVDEPLAMVSGLETYFYHVNHLYSVSALTSAQGVVVERYGYGPYGQRVVLNADGSLKEGAAIQSYGFTGRELDGETGLWYFRARYFDDSLGRFIGRDTLGYVDGWSVYRGYFVPNQTDYTGLCAWNIESTQVAEHGLQGFQLLAAGTFFNHKAKFSGGCPNASECGEKDLSLRQNCRLTYISNENGVDTYGSPPAFPDGSQPSVAGIATGSFSVTGVGVGDNDIMNYVITCQTCAYCCDECISCVNWQLTPDYNTPWQNVGAHPTTGDNVHVQRWRAITRGPDNGVVPCLKDHVPTPPPGEPYTPPPGDTRSWQCPGGLNHVTAYGLHKCLTASERHRVSRLGGGSLLPPDGQTVRRAILVILQGAPDAEYK